MKTFTYELTLKENSEADAETKMKAIAAIAAALSPKEMEKLAHIVKHDPAKLAMAKAALGV